MSIQDVATDVEAEIFSHPKIDRSDLKFKCKSDVFDYFFVSLINSGEDMVKSAEQASVLADTVAKIKCIPDVEPDLIDGLIQKAEKLFEQAEKHPKMAELVMGIITGVGTFAAGVVSGKTIEDDSIKDFDESLDEVNFEEIEEK